MLTWINKIVQSIYVKKYKPKKYRDLSSDMLSVYEEHGFGLYLVNIKRTSKPNFVSKIISKYSGDFVHSILVLYSDYDTMTKIFNNAELKKIVNNLTHYYSDFSGNLNMLRTLVMGSADSDGINCCSFSAYQNRKLSIRKLPLDLKDIKIVCKSIVPLIGDPYDATGLVGWVFKKILDDKNTYYCSELCYDMCKKVGLKISKTENPSPKDIEDYNKDLIVYKNF